MNAVGIDVSKGKSMIAVMRAYGEVVASPYGLITHQANWGSWQTSLKALTVRHE